MSKDVGDYTITVSGKDHVVNNALRMLINNFIQSHALGVKIEVQTELVTQGPKAFSSAAEAEAILQQSEAYLELEDIRDGAVRIDDAVGLSELEAITFLMRGGK